jgi:hypothetical protein
MVMVADSGFHENRKLPKSLLKLEFGQSERAVTTFSSKWRVCDTGDRQEFLSITGNELSQLRLVSLSLSLSLSHT